MSRAAQRLGRWAPLALLALAACEPRVAAAPDGAAPPPAAAPETRPLPAGPSVLLVTIDTLRADHVGAYGAQGVETPVIDGLAQEGVRFEKAIAPTPLTLPSHASILTGLYPPRHGVRHNGIHRLAPDIDTVATRLAAAGYDTAAVVGSIVLGKRYGLGRGFATYDEDMSSQRASATGYPERSAAAVSDRAIEWLSRRDRPFFLWVHYYDPHAAYQPPSPYAERFRDRPYDGEIASVDAALGRVVGALRQSGRLESTLVVVTADHGESLGEHGERTHGYGLYDATLAVPLVLRGPGVPAGRVLGGVVSTVDVAPTILALLGQPPLAGVDGRDLAQRWTDGSAPADEVAYAETLATRIDHGWSPLHALRSPTHHYVRAPRPELYDVRSDPGERTNLAVQPSAQVGAEIARLDAGIAQRLEAGARADAAPAASGAVALDEATREQLVALGYALPATPVPANGIDPKDGLRFVGDFVAAKSAFYGGDLARAEAIATPLLASMPASAELHELLARLLLARGRPDLARVHAETAAKLVPASAQAHLLVALAAADANDADGAIAAYAEAAARDPESGEARIGAVWAAARAGRVAEAEAIAEKAKAQEPANAGLCERLGATWERVGEIERARAAYEAALRLDPSSGSAHMALAIQLARLGRDADSARERSLAGAFASQPPFLNRLAVVYAARGDVGRAEALFRDLLETHPGYAGARRNLALLLRRDGRDAEALRVENGG